MKLKSRLLLTAVHYLCLMHVITCMEESKDFIVGSNIALLSNRLRRQEGIFLNLGSPSPCRGTVSSWNFCYSCPRNGQYHAVFMVYQLNSSSLQYEVLPESVIQVSVVCSQKGAIQCKSRTLSVSEQFLIENGDNIAVCLPNDGRESIRMISSAGGSDEFGAGDIHEYTDNGDDTCAMSKLRAVNYEALLQNNAIQLHLFTEARTDSEVITNSTTTGVEVITSSTSPSNITDEENKSLLNETDDTLELDTSWSTHTTEMPHVLSTTTDLFPKDVKVISITIPGLVITLLVILTILLVLGIFMSQRRKSQNKRLPPENDVEEQCHYSCATANHFHMSANVSYDCVNNHFSSQGCRYVNSSIPEESNIYDTIDTL